MLAAVSLGLLYLLGLGLLVCVPLWPGEVDRRGEGSPTGGFEPVRSACAVIAVLLGSGLLVDLTLLLVLEGLTFAMRVGGIAAILGLLLGARAFATRVRPPADWSAAYWLVPLPALYLIGLFGSRILADPLQNWDARSIWFFHAKILFYDGGFSADSGWTDLAFSHPDYPKLLPALAAQVAHGAGHWNEYLPKTALLFLLIPAVLAFFGSVRSPISAVFLGAFFFLRPYPLLWNGQADGYLAIYAALAALSCGRFMDSRRPLDLALALVCAGVACSLKNEGAFFALCLFASMLLAWGRLVARGRGSPTWAVPRAGLLVVLALAPLLIWWLKARAWSLPSDLELSVESLSRMWERAADGESLIALTRALVGELTPLFLPLALGVGAALAFRARPGPGVGVVLLTPLLYAVVIFGAYLGTPHDLQWHLQTSIHRTPMPILLTGAAVVFLLLEVIERSGDAGASEARASSKSAAQPV